MCVSIYKSIHVHGIHRPDEDKPPREDLWKQAKNRRKKKKILIGKQELQEAFSGAPAVRSVFLWNVSKDSEDAKVSKHIADNCDGLISVRRWSHPDAPLKSFKVTVRKECADTLLSPEFPWPCHVKVRRFVPARGPPPVDIGTCLP